MTSLVEHAFGEDLVRRPGTDGLQHHGHLAADLDRHVVVEEVVAQRADDAVAELREGVGRRFDELGLGQVFHDVTDERSLLQPADCRNRRSSHLGIIVGNQLAQLPLEHVGEEGQQARGFEAGALTGRALLVDHASEHQTCRVQVLRAPGPRQEGDERGADREVLEVAKLLDARDRVDVVEGREIQERLGSHLERRIVQQDLNLVLDGDVAGARQHGDGMPPDLRFGVAQQTPDCRMDDAVVRHLEQAQRVRRSHGRRPSGATRSAPRCRGRSPAGWLARYRRDADGCSRAASRHTACGRPPRTRSRRPAAPGTPTTSRPGSRPARRQTAG